MILRRISATAAILGGAILCGSPFVFGVRPLRRTIPIDVLVVAAPLLLVVGLLGFYVEYGPAYTLKGRLGIWLVWAGLVAVTPILTHRTIVFYSLEQGVPLILLGLAGIVLVQAGTIGVGIDAYQSDIPSKTFALAFPLAAPISASANYLGASLLGGSLPIPIWFGMEWITGLFGLFWIGLGYYVLHPPGTQVEGSVMSDPA